MSRTMRVDGNIGGSIDRTGGADLAVISEQARARRQTIRRCRRSYLRGRG
jgi:hypothetical protein